MIGLGVGAAGTSLLVLLAMRVDGQKRAAAATAVSKVAANSGVRTEMRIRQQEWATAHGGGVIEGRDIATVVFPDALLKVFLTASPEVRAQRRVDQSGGNVSEIAAAIAERDLLDSTRADSPLASSSDSVVVDTSDRAIDDVVDEIEKLFIERIV
jgi:cytidylate kinase